MNALSTLVSVDEQQQQQQREQRPPFLPEQPTQRLTNLVLTRYPVVTAMAEQADTAESGYPRMYTSMLAMMREDRDSGDDERNHCLPRFLIIGSQKGGTTSLNAWLKWLQYQQRSSSNSSDHRPWVSMPKWDKELNVLSERVPMLMSWRRESSSPSPSSTTERPWWIPHDMHSMQDVWRWTQAQYEGSGASNALDFLKQRVGECQRPQDLRGDASPNYFNHPLAPLLAQHLLQKRTSEPLKLVLLLRNPWDRLVSAFNMKWQIRQCGQGAWRRADCFRDLVGGDGDSDTWLTLARDFVDSLDQALTRELSDMESCYHQYPPSDPTMTLRELLTASRVRCASLPARFDPETHEWTLDEVQSLYYQNEDHAFLRRSVYAKHLTLWLHFFPDPKQWQIIMARDFETTPVPVVRELLAFLELDHSRVPDSAPSRQLVRHTRSYIIDQAEKNLSGNADAKSELVDIRRQLESVKRRACRFLRPRNEELFQLLEPRWPSLNITYIQSLFLC